MPRFLKLSERLLGEKTITENGTYPASADSLDGFSQITVQVAGSGGGGVTEIATPEEMESFKTEANFGTIVKYIGTSDDTYTNGALYTLKKMGGNIALFDESTFSSDMGAYMVVMEESLETPFNSGMVDINFKINGGPVQTFTTPLLEFSGIRAISFDPNTGSPLTIYQDADFTIMYMGYLNINANTGSAPGQSHMCMIMSTATGSPTSAIVEIVSYSVGSDVVTSPVTYSFESYFKLSTPLYPIATADEIAQGCCAYTDKGVLVVGTLQSPPVLDTADKYYAALANNANVGKVFNVQVTGIEGIETSGYYKQDLHFDTIPVMRELMEMDRVGDTYAVGYSRPHAIMAYQTYDRPYAYAYCYSLRSVDFITPNALSLTRNLFQGCSFLEKVIIRCQDLPLAGADMFIDTPIANGTGYIYVLDDMVDTYKAAEHWSTWASQIKPLSELEA